MPKQSWPHVTKYDLKVTSRDFNGLEVTGVQAGQAGDLVCALDNQKCLQKYRHLIETYINRKWTNVYVAKEWFKKATAQQKRIFKNILNSHKFGDYEWHWKKTRGYYALGPGANGNGYTPGKTDYNYGLRITNI